MLRISRHASAVLIAALTSCPSLTAQANANVQEASAPKYDLSALKGPQERVGDRVVEEYRESLDQVVDAYQGGKRTGRQEKSEGCAYERLVEVLELGPARFPNKLLLEYRTFRDLATKEEVPVSDVRIEMIKRESAWSGDELNGRLLPPILDARFSAELLERSNKPEVSIVRETALPKAPVAVGDTWEIKPSEILDRVSMFEYNADKSTARGKLAAVRKEGNATWITVEFDVELACEAINGRPFKSPAAVKAHLTLDVPSSGGVYCEKAMTFELKGVLDGSDVDTEAHLLLKGGRRVVCKPYAPAKEHDVKSQGGGK